MTSTLMTSVLTTKVTTNDGTTMYYSELLNNIIYYVMVSESIIGISGNGLGIAILRKHNLAASSSKLLLALCANDLLICFFMCGTGIQKLFIYLEGKYNYVLMISVTNVLNLVSTLVFSVLVPISLILTTSISVERFIAVCFPFHVSRIMTSGRISVYIILIYAFFGVVASPAFLRNSLLFEYSPLYNATVVVVRYSEYYLINRTYIDTYLVKVLGNTLVAVCLPVIFVSTVTITIKLVWRKMEHVSEQGTRKKSVNQYKIIKMLTTVCSLTFLTYLAGQSIYTVRSFFPDEIFSSLTGEIYLSAYRLVMHVNASANFIIYICMCKKFRIEFLAIVLYVPKHILRIIKLFHI